MTHQQRWQRIRAESLRLLAKDAHHDWMDECVPYLMGFGKDQITAVAACLNMWRDTWEANHPDGTPDPGPPKPEKVLAGARELLREFNEADHPRQPAGSPGGTGGEFVGDNTGDDDGVALDPNVVNVGGDAWNKATAKRLEREYQKVKAQLEAIAAAHATPSKPSDDSDVEDADDEDQEPDENYVPDSWDSMSGDDQSAAESHYYDNKLAQYVEDEHNNWQNNGGALDEAKGTLASDDTWIGEQIEDWMTGKEEDVPGEGPGEPFTETKFPFTPDQLKGAISMDYDADGEGSGKVHVKFDDKFLDLVPLTDPSQMTLPGIEPGKNSDALTKEMRIELTTMLKAKLNEAAEDKQSEMDFPDYLEQQAKEYMEENWQHNMTDGEKFDYALHDTDILEGVKDVAFAEGEVAGVVGLPEKYDPLNDTSGTDYKKTQRLARTMSIERAEQVLKARELPYPGDGKMKQLDGRLWQSWKSSSTSSDGLLLQLATADELGGRLNEKTGRGGMAEIKRANIEGHANNEFASIGGYKGVLAYVRAKWETTQFLLDKAGISDLQVYRGIALDNEKFAVAEREKMIKQMVQDHAKVPTHIVRNGAASTTTNPKVANDWSSDSTRLVLRMHVPRTAAVSVPAYGINVKSEQEVVIAGTAWKSWDAWLGKAPSFDKVGMAA